MSGPKVVRVVTRQELESLCRRQIALFEAAAKDFQATAERVGLWDRAGEETIRERRARLEALFHGEQWQEVQTQGRLHEQFLLAEAKRLESKAIDEAQAEKRRRRQLIDSARTIVSALQAAGAEVPPALAELQTRGFTGSTVDLAGIVEAGFQALTDSEKDTATANEVRELAARLSEGEQRVALAEHLAAFRTEDGKDQRLERLLAEVDVLGPASAPQFAARADAAYAESSPKRRALLVDSLILDATEHVRNLRARDEKLGAMKRAMAELLGDSAEIHTIRKRLESAIAGQKVADADLLVAEAKQANAIATAKAAAEQRRKVVLEAFAALGYEVREGMATAWAQNGRVVVKKAGVADYGVELGSTAGVEQMQVRLVGASTPTEPRTTQRDRDMETQWCSDFTRLRELVTKRGSELSLERALPVGAQAVKTVDLGEPAATAPEQLRVPGVRRRS